MLGLLAVGASVDWKQEYKPSLGEHIYLAVSNMNLEAQVDPVYGRVMAVSVDIVSLPTNQILILIKTDTDDAESMMAARRIEYNYRKRIGQLIRSYWSKVGITEEDFAYKITGKDFSSMLGGK